jgi:hypothetical protein
VLPSMTAAKEAAERMRRQGSTWTITEIPVVAFVGTSTRVKNGSYERAERALVITEFRNASPLAPFAAILPEEPTFNTVRERLSPPVGRTFSHYLLDFRELQLGARRCQRYSAVPQGRGYHLDWESRPSGQDFAGVLAVVAAFANVPPLESSRVG